MVSRRLVMAAIAVLVPIVAVNATLVSESAAVTPVKGTGSITCSYGTTTSAATAVKVTFNPPLARSPGTLVHATKQPNEVITIAKAILGKCTRTPSGNPAVTGGLATAAVTAKIPAVSLGSGKWDVGSCNIFMQMLWAKVTTHFSWSGPTIPLINSTLVTKTSTQSRVVGRLGFVASGTATGSFAGTNSSITGIFNAPSATAISNTCGGATSKVATATLSATLSTIHLGT